jgi:hypothetical protein
VSWDPFQREALEAMGYRLFELHGAQAGEAAAAPATAAMPDETQASGQAADIGPLLRALLRACGRRPDDARALALCRELLPPGGLRDAATRRALWPRLRALRAGRAR